MLIQEQDTALIQVSGTAAIDEMGHSLHPGDIRSQIDCTFGKIEALLGQVGTGLRDAAAACVFIKQAKDMRIFHDLARGRDLAHFPAVVMVADICRPELLFEIDAEVVG